MNNYLAVLLAIFLPLIYQTAADQNTLIEANFKLCPVPNDSSQLNIIDHALFRKICIKNELQSSNKLDEQSLDTFFIFEKAQSKRVDGQALKCTLKEIRITTTGRLFGADQRQINEKFIDQTNSTLCSLYHELLTNQTNILYNGSFVTTLDGYQMPFINLEYVLFEERNYKWVHVKFENVNIESATLGDDLYLNKKDRLNCKFEELSCRHQQGLVVWNESILIDSTQNRLILKDNFYRFDSKFLLNQDFSVQIELRTELIENNNNMTYFETNFDNIFVTREQSLITGQALIENLNDRIKILNNKFTQIVLNQVQNCEDKFSLFSAMKSGDFIDFEFENQSVLFSAENGDLVRVDCDNIDRISVESQLNECYEDIPVLVNDTERVFLSNNNILLENSEVLNDCESIQRKIAIKGTRFIVEQTSDQLRVSQIDDESSHMVHNLGSINFNNKLILSKNSTNLKAENVQNNNYTYIKEKSVVQGKEEERTLYTIMIILFVFVNTCLIAYLIYMVCCILKRKSFSNTKSIAMEFCLNRNRRRKSGMKNAVNMDKEVTGSTTDSNRKLELKQEISNEGLSELKELEQV